MNYPIWLTSGLGGGNLIALISILHVYAAHLAVGGGLLIYLLDRKAYLSSDDRLNSFLQRYNWIFLLTTVVFGAVSGLGIWFIIALIHPSATSALIHTFVFAWAIEWVFFLAEIAAILIYHYYFTRLDRQTRLKIALLYALFAWLSLFIINGILSYMLTPGKWLQTHNFWHGFFNPSFFSSLFFRSFIALIVAGISTFVIGAFQTDSSSRVKAVRIGTRWVICAIIGLVPSAVWYYFSLPTAVRITAFALNNETIHFLRIFIFLTPALLIIALLFAFKAPAAYQRSLAVLAALIGLLWIGGYEYSREIARKPFIIYGYMYSNSVLVSEADKLNTQGFLIHAKWPKVKLVEQEGAAALGKELFLLQCYSCHTIGGLRNDILPRTRSFTYDGMLAQLTGQGKVRNYMPPFFGTQTEKAALAYYIANFLHRKETTPPPAAPDLPGLGILIPPKSQDYTLLVWNDTGMRCISDNDRYFALFPPGNTLQAQLIKRGDPPQLQKSGLKITYEIQPGFDNPAAQIDFWKFAQANYGLKLKDNLGLDEFGLKGEMKFDEARALFYAPNLPAAPYDHKGKFFPYPAFTIRALDYHTGEILAETKVIAPVSAEMSCSRCHGGTPGGKTGPGLSSETAANILLIHDRNEGTKLLKNALSGKPSLCQSCHADHALGKAGAPAVLNLSAALHGWHANYMFYPASQACLLCHPGGDTGYTRCLRGLHRKLPGGCVRCHGSIELHAISLLNYEADKPAAQRLLANLHTAEKLPPQQINPRQPWQNEPDCLNCHLHFNRPDSNAAAYNRWTGGKDELFRRRADNAGLACPACHNSPHAEYPALNPYGPNLDVIQPLQYMNAPYPIGANKNCKVCHTVQYEEALHHENIAGKFRNPALAK